MKTYFEYRSMRAIKGKAQEKKSLLEKFKMASNCYEHSIILCYGDSPRPEWLKQKEEFKKEMEETAKALEEILK